MVKKINKKDIVCYNCDKVGIAKLLPRLVDILKTLPDKTRPGKHVRVRTGKKKTIYIWVAKGFQLLGTDSFLCDECSKNKCKKCHILLGNRKCPSCGKNHGAFYEDHPKYCEQCWDEIEASKKP